MSELFISFANEIAARLAYDIYMRREKVVLRVLNGEPTLNFEDWYNIIWLPKINKTVKD